MSNPGLFKSFTAGAAIAAFRIVKFSAAETVVPAAAVSDSLLGVNSEVAPALGERCDVALSGIAYVEAGAALALGALVTSDGVGRGVLAAPAAGVNNRIIGVAMEAASAAGDVIRVMLQQGSTQG
ncbi:MAG: DUF2190 family protein [Polaromonas sp.]|nr:DUF2190 family protein [Polaromonas sp.]